MAIDLRADSDLLADCGNPTSYATLVARHQRHLESRVRRYIRDHHAVRDVCQEIFIDLWASPGQYDPTRGTLTAFLALRARSRSIDWIRSQTARTRREQAWRPVTEQRDEPHELIADPAVLAALDRLPMAEADLIRATFFHGLTHEELAARTGIPVGTVKSRIRRGLHRLRSVTAIAAFAE